MGEKSQESLKIWKHLTQSLNENTLKLKKPSRSKQASSLNANKEIKLQRNKSFAVKKIESKSLVIPKDDRKVIPWKNSEVEVLRVKSFDLKLIPRTNNKMQMVKLKSLKKFKF